MTGRAVALRFVLLPAICWAWPLFAAESPTPIPHGSQVTRAAVGPGALGLRTERWVEGGEITDGKSPAYAVLVRGGANYDGFAVAGPHLLIENVTIEGGLDISVRLPVVLRGVTVLASRGQPWLVLVRPGAGTLHVLWSDVGGAMVKRSASPHVGVALALRGDGARVYRSRVGAAADGIQIAGRDIRITECEIANLLSGPGDHNDAVQLFDTAQSVEISRSRIENRHAQTSAITVLGRDVTILDNVIAGGGWSLYGGAKRNGKGDGGARGVRIENNIFARTLFPKVGSFGPVTYWDSGSGNVWRENSDDSRRPILP